MLLMVRVVDVMVLLMPMLLQVMDRLMSRVRALWVVLLRLGGGIASDEVGGEGAVGDAPGVAVAEVALLVVLLLMPVLRTLQVILHSTVSLVMMMMRVLQVALCGRSLACVRARAISVPGWGLGGRRCWPVLLVALTVRVRRRWCTGCLGRW